MKTGRGRGLYRRFCRPHGKEYAEFLRRHGNFHSIGAHCYVSPGANITDAAYVKIGNNVRINECAIFGHDGTVNMINRAFGLRLDSVGKVDIRDNVFVGYGAIILQNVSIGPNAIVAAGSVVTKDVPEGAVVAGAPAKQVSTVTAYVEKLKAANANYPWRNLIEKRDSEFDASIEGVLVGMRVKHFFPGALSVGADEESEIYWHPCTAPLFPRRTVDGDLTSRNSPTWKRCRDGKWEYRQKTPFVDDWGAAVKS